MLRRGEAVWACILDFAARDIDVGEELTIDYGVVEGARP